MMHFTTVKTDEEIYQIIELQKNNLTQNLTKEQIVSQGFVTVVHSYEVLKKMNDTEASVVAKFNDKVVGYLLAMTRQARNDIPVLIPMFNAFDEVIYENKKISSFNYIVVGQVCIADGYRGKGILGDCYAAYKNHLMGKYDFAITEIHKNNQRSINAHNRIGFKSIHSYIDPQGEQWEIVIWDWRKK